MLFLLMQLSAATIQLDAKGPVSVRNIPIKVAATPAGDRDEDCAFLRLYTNTQSQNLTHQFCRSARLYDMNFGVAIVNDNVSVSTLTLYRIRNGKLIKLSYMYSHSVNPASMSFNLSGSSKEVLRFDLEILFEDKVKVGPRKLAYRCLIVNKAGISDATGLCQA